MAKALILSGVGFLPNRFNYFLQIKVIFQKLYAHVMWFSSVKLCIVKSERQVSSYKDESRIISKDRVATSVGLPAYGLWLSQIKESFR